MNVIYMAIALTIIFITLIIIEEIWTRRLPNYRTGEYITREITYIPRYVGVLYPMFHLFQHYFDGTFDGFTIFLLSLILIFATGITIYLIKRYRGKHIYNIKKTNRSLFRFIKDINPEDGRYKIILKDFGVVELHIPESSYHEEDKILEEVKNMKELYRTTL